VGSISTGSTGTAIRHRSPSKGVLICCCKPTQSRESYSRSSSARPTYSSRALLTPNRSPQLLTPPPMFLAQPILPQLALIGPFLEDSLFSTIVVYGGQPSMPTNPTTCPDVVPQCLTPGCSSQPAKITRITIVSAKTRPSSRSLRVRLILGL